MREAYQIVVVGGGGAGLACAARAAELGADVLLLERRPGLGGTTALAVGSFTAAGTSFQRAAGVEDDPDDHEEDAGRFGPPEHQARNNSRLRRLFLGEAAPTLDWLTSLGLEFRGPSPEPPNRVPRMHNVVPNATAYVAALHERLTALGGTAVCNAPVDELVQEDGRIAGVVARVDGVRTRVRGRHGVVLAAGDYAGSAELISEHRGPRFGAIEGINPHATGDGHRLAARVGARLVNMDITYGPELRFVPPAERAEWLHPEDTLLAEGAILVNGEGRRFCDETSSPEREIAVAAQPGKIAYLLLDQRLARRYAEWPHFLSTAPEIAYAYVSDYLRLRPDVAVAGPLDAVAQSRRLPVAAVRTTVEAASLKGSQWVLLGPVKAYFTTTEGGAAIDESLRVLDGDDRPVPGLYAVGQTGLGGMVLWGHGLHIAWALTSGRLAGETLGPLGGVDAG